MALHRSTEGEASARVIVCAVLRSCLLVTLYTKLNAEFCGCHFNQIFDFNNDLTQLTSVVRRSY